MLKLSLDRSLKFVLMTGVQGRITQGSVSRSGEKRIDVYDQYGRLMAYISGDRVRSWCVFNVNDEPIIGWHEIEPQDAELMGRGYRAHEFGDSVLIERSRAVVDDPAR